MIGGKHSTKRPLFPRARQWELGELQAMGMDKREHIQDTFRSQISSSWSPRGQGDGNVENSSQVSGPHTSMDGGTFRPWRLWH